ncbi:hypothetical protein [Burkholderia sp. TSV86]|uniref:hypothetical protein n=1 Tax=Burkholderia sp. TSV86 TaxID=1385594 RepID=UPI000A434F57|nr:hypothetical protein [Burkholderia sp. TSV86]
MVQSACGALAGRQSDKNRDGIERTSERRRQLPQQDSVNGNFVKKLEARCASPWRLRQRGASFGKAIVRAGWFFMPRGMACGWYGNDY